VSGINAFETDRSLALIARMGSHRGREAARRRTGESRVLADRPPAAAVIANDCGNVLMHITTTARTR